MNNVLIQFRYKFIIVLILLFQCFSYSIIDKQYLNTKVFTASKFNLISMSSDKTINTLLFKRAILKSLGIKLGTKFKKYIDFTLEVANIFEIDPVWAISIMWTESHFNNSSKSNVGASGLMQIMPATGHYLLNKLKYKINYKNSKKLLKNPLQNIFVGIFYLKRLLNRFKNNYSHATIAYNMGPGWVRKKIRNKIVIGTDNDYLDKVKKRYVRLSKNIINKSCHKTNKLCGKSYFN